MSEFMIVNPPDEPRDNPGRRRRRRSSSGRRRRRSASGRFMSARAASNPRPRRRRRRRANPYLLANAPRRRRRRSARTVQARRRRRHNPALFGGRAMRLPAFLGGIDIGAAAISGTAAVGNEFLTGLATNALPAQLAPLKSGPGRLVAKLLIGGLALGVLRKPLGSRMTDLAAAGIGTVLFLDVYRQFIAPNVPGLPQISGLGDYVPEMSGLGQTYMPGQEEIEELGAYSQSVPIATFAPAWGA